MSECHEDEMIQLSLAYLFFTFQITGSWCWYLVSGCLLASYDDSMGMVCSYVQKQRYIVNWLCEKALRTPLSKQVVYRSM